MRLKNKKAELKQRVQVNLPKYVGMFVHDSNYNIRSIFTNAKLRIFRVPKNQKHSKYSMEVFQV